MKMPKSEGCRKIHNTVLKGFIPGIIYFCGEKVGGKIHLCPECQSNQKIESKSCFPKVSEGCGKELEKPNMDGSPKFCGELGDLCPECQPSRSVGSQQEWTKAKTIDIKFKSANTDTPIDKTIKNLKEIGLIPDGTDTLKSKILNKFHRNKFSVRNGHIKVIEVEYVKEFIRQLKEEIKSWAYDDKERWGISVLDIINLQKRIDKISGFGDSS